MDKRAFTTMQELLDNFSKDEFSESSPYKVVTSSSTEDNELLDINTEFDIHTQFDLAQ